MWGLLIDNVCNVKSFLVHHLKRGPRVDLATRIVFIRTGTFDYNSITPIFSVRQCYDCQNTHDGTNTEVTVTCNDS